MNDFEKITALKKILFKHTMLIELKEDYQILINNVFKELYTTTNFQKKDKLKIYIDSYSIIIAELNKKIDNITNEIIEIIK